MEEKKRFFIIALVCVAAALLYWVCPIDLLPDFITGIGWVDDLIFGLIGFMGSMVNFFLGLSVGIRLTEAKNNQIRWEEDFRQTYGTYYEV